MAAKSWWSYPSRCANTAKNREHVVVDYSNPIQQDNSVRTETKDPRNCSKKKTVLCFLGYTLDSSRIEGHLHLVHGKLMNYKDACVWTVSFLVRIVGIYD
jgi:hypothetical protein